MARKPRIQYPGAICHIRSRGNLQTSDEIVTFDIVTPGGIIVMRDPELSLNETDSPLHSRRISGRRIFEADADHLLPASVVSR